jgi:hypothetical protein
MTKIVQVNATAVYYNNAKMWFSWAHYNFRVSCLEMKGDLSLEINCFPQPRICNCAYVGNFLQFNFSYTLTLKAFEKFCDVKVENIDPGSKVCVFSTSFAWADCLTLSGPCAQYLSNLPIIFQTNCRLWSFGLLLSFPSINNQEHGYWCFRINLHVHGCNMWAEFAFPFPRSP